MTRVLFWLLLAVLALLTALILSAPVPRVCDEYEMGCATPASIEGARP